ncbi:MAG: helix-turn-helix domain-containing protein [Rhodospirillaceae bacterium]
MDYSVTGELGELGGNPPSSETELGGRIASVVRLYKTKKLASLAAGVRVDMLTRYEKGLNVPAFDVLARLAAPHGVDLNWLATGKGTMHQAAPMPAQPEPAPAAAAPTLIDFVLMGRLNEALKALYKDEGIRIDDRGFGELLAEKYEEIATATDDPDERIAMVKLIISQLRKELRSGHTRTANGNGSA